MKSEQERTTKEILAIVLSDILCCSRISGFAKCKFQMQNINTFFIIISNKKYLIACKPSADLCEITPFTLRVHAASTLGLPKQAISFKNQTKHHGIASQKDRFLPPLSVSSFSFSSSSFLQSSLPSRPV
jgi:hypothetical protein